MVDSDILIPWAIEVVAEPAGTGTPGDFGG